MSRVEGSVTIAVTPEVIQAALEDVAHAPEWTNSLEKVWDVKGKGAGCTYKWTFKLPVGSFDGQTTILESSTEKLVMETEGGIPSKWIWNIRPFGSRTKVDVTVEYTVPGGSKLGALADKLVVEGQNQKELDETLANLKARLEG
jgi:uncharacterized membrane protein